MKTVLTILILGLTRIGLAGTDVGSGGDLVKCVPYSSNDLFGLYSLDYLVFSREQGAQQPKPVSSWQESIFNIRRVFIDKLPELLPIFDEFTNNILNEDQSRPQIWEPTDYALTEINDEDLPISVRIPVNCRENGQIQLVQAVVRQHPEFTGSPLIVYKYMPRIFEKVAEERPLQLSFLLLHEFLWSISNSVDRNRRINWFLHSQEIQNLSRVQIIDRLLGMGLDVKTVPRILDSTGRGHFLTLQEALAKAREGETIIIKEGVYSTGGASIVLPLKLVGEGDREKIIVKGTRNYPALDIALEPGQILDVQNLTLVRDIEFGNDRDYYEQHPLFISGGEARIKNSVIKSSSKYIAKLTNKENLKLENDVLYGYKGIRIDLDYRGQVEITNSIFNTENDALVIDSLARFNGRFVENTFQVDCAVDMYIDAYGGNDPKYAERVERAKIRFGPMFVNNKYPKYNGDTKRFNWCAPNWRL